MHWGVKIILLLSVVLTLVSLVIGTKLQLKSMDHYRIGNLIDVAITHHLAPPSPVPHVHFMYWSRYYTSAQSHIVGNIFMKLPPEIQQTLLPAARKALKASGFLEDFVRQGRSWWSYNVSRMPEPLLRILCNFAQSILEVNKRDLDQFVDLAHIPDIENTMIVHYRVGDFLKNGVIEVERVARTSRTLLQNGHRRPLPIRAVYILNGGFYHKHDSLSGDVLSKSKSLLQDLTQRLQRMHPNAQIVQQQAESSADVDWLCMTRCGYLVTGAGSYALTAAMCNKNGLVRTPALKGGCPNQGWTLPRQLTNSWSTYA